jgi:hypothetical protein
MADITARESKLGRVFDIDHNYHAFTDPFPNWREQWDLAGGRIPFISWAGISTTEITSGADDALIAARADGIKTLGQPVFLRWFWEMDSKNHAALVVSPASYIAAWNHLRAIFAARGATNAAWVWCPTSYGFKTGTAQRFYPGDGAVDWICADGYNWAPGKPGSKWTSFGKIFDAFYAWGVQRPRPLIVGEYGAQERSPGEKAAWVLDARTTMQNKFTNIAGLVYFDANKTYDWRMDTTSSALDAFRTTALDPYFNPTHAPGLPGGGTPSGGGGSGTPTTTTTTTGPSPTAPPPSSTTTTTAPSPSKRHGGHRTGHSQGGNGQQ